MWTVDEMVIDCNKLRITRALELCVVACWLLEGLAVECWQVLNDTVEG